MGTREEGNTKATKKKTQFELPICILVALAEWSSEEQSMAATEWQGKASEKWGRRQAVRAVGWKSKLSVVATA